MSDNRVQLSVRLTPEDMALLGKNAMAGGFEKSVAARAVLELVCQHMRAGNDFIDTLFVLKSALGVKPAPVVEFHNSTVLEPVECPASLMSPQSAGGRARADALSPDRRSEIARSAANKRWSDY